MNVRRIISALVISLTVFTSGQPFAAGETAGDVVKNTAADVLERLQAEKSQLEVNPGRIYELINELVIPHFDFYSMSRLVLGNAWKAATGQQQQAFVEQFRTLLVRTYANALNQYSENEIIYYPEQPNQDSSLVVVRSEVKDIKGSASIPVHYRMHTVDGAWKVVDVPIDGISLVSTYRGSFSSEIRKSGLDALISAVMKKNQKTAITQAQ